MAYYMCQALFWALLHKKKQVLYFLHFIDKNNEA